MSHQLFWYKLYFILDGSSAHFYDIWTMHFIFFWCRIYDCLGIICPMWYTIWNSPLKMQQGSVHGASAHIRYGTREGEISRDNSLPLPLTLLPDRNMMLLLWCLNQLAIYCSAKLEDVCLISKYIPISAFYALLKSWSALILQWGNFKARNKWRGRENEML